MKHHIAIIYNFNDDFDSFQGGSQGGLKSEISYFDQFLISYESITKNWNTEKFTYDFHIVHTRDFSQTHFDILNNIGINTIKVKNEFNNIGLRCMTFNVDIECDYRLVLDNDTIGIKTPNFDFSKDILVSYGGGIYPKDTYKQLCNFLGLKTPKENPIENVVQSFGAAEYTKFYKETSNKRLFPALNAGAILVKNTLSKEFGKKLTESVRKIPEFAKQFGGRSVQVVQPVYGLVVNDITDNWNHFERGFNFILSDFRQIPSIYKEYKGDIYLAHYINYPKFKDGLNLDIPHYHRKVLKKYKKKNKIYFYNSYKTYLKNVPNENFNISLNEIDKISDGLNNNKNFTIMRFNDGEWAFSQDYKPYINKRLKELHTSEEAKVSLNYAGRLLKKIIDGEPEYMVSIDSQSYCVKPYKNYIDNNIHKFKDVIGGGIFNLWSFYTGFYDLFKIFQKRNTVVVGPEYLRDLPFDSNYIIVDSVKAIYDLQKNVWEIIRWLDKNYEPNMVIIYSCSFLAKVAIDEIYKIYGDTITQLDMGASLNPFVGINNRPWQKSIIDNIKINKKIKKMNKIGKNVNIHKFAYVEDNVEIGDNTKIGPFCIVRSGAKIGKNCSFTAYCEIRENVVIGDNTSFGSRCTISANANIGKDCVIKYGFVLTDTPNLEENSTKLVKGVGDGVLIGANVTLMPGKSIGNNSIIGACSQVRKNIPDNEVWYGSPAKKLRDNK